MPFLFHKKSIVFRQFTFNLTLTIHFSFSVTLEAWITQYLFQRKSRKVSARMIWISFDKLHAARSKKNFLI